MTSNTAASHDDDVQIIHVHLDALLCNAPPPLPEQLSSLVVAFLPSQPPALHSKAYHALSTLCRNIRSSLTDGSDAGTESLSRIFQPLTISWLSESQDSDALAGVSFLTALFQVDRQSASHIFGEDGFIDLLSTLIVSPSPPMSLEVARLFAQACRHKACRPMISAEVVTWLRSQSVQTGSRALSMAAILALIKLSRGASSLEETPSVEPQDEQFTAQLKEVITKTNATYTSVNDVVEGLTYLSVNPVAKSALADAAFLTELFSLVAKHTSSSGLHDHATILYGILVIASNLCSYKPRLSQEERQIAKLRNLAESGGKHTDSKPVEAATSVLEDDAQVQARCRVVIDSGILGVLSVAAGAESTASRTTAGRIYLSLVEDKGNRGKVLQGGGAKNLLRIIKAYSLSSSGMPPPEVLIPIQALAKLAITSSPIQVFGPNEGNMLDAIRPFSQLVLHPSASTLQQFEAMMALTNLASYNPACASKIATTPHFLNKIELLLLEDHTLIRRASCELICNLIAGSDDVFARYGGEDSGQAAKSKIQILLAMSDVDDMPTRLAASGALAMLTSDRSACRVVFDLQREHHRAFSVIAQLIDPSTQVDETSCENRVDTGDPGLVHRGVVCFRNILDGEKSLPRMELSEEAERTSLSRIFARLLKGELGAYDPAILQTAAEVTRRLVELGSGD
ncbi:armadillo-type protein [Scleroderma yunnanense]